MYHIPHDKRAQKSAQAIFEALMTCLDDAALTSVSVSDISRISGASRTTFYRLFDNVYDVLDWKCEEMMTEALALGERLDQSSSREVLVRFVGLWVSEPRLVAAFANGDGLDVLSRLHRRHAEEIARLFFPERELTTFQKEQLAQMLAGVMPIAFRDWLQNPEEKPEAILARARSGVRLLGSVLDR